MFQHISLPFELPDFCVHSAHMAWDTRRTHQLLFLLECTLLDLDFGLHVLKLLFRLGEFCRRFLTAPLESTFGNAPLPVLLYEPRCLVVKALDICREGRVVLPRLLLRLTSTGEQRIDVIFLTGILGPFARDVGASGISRTGPDDATDTGANGGPPPPANERAYPSPYSGPYPRPYRCALYGRALGV